MSFEQYWLGLQSSLKPGTSIKNWTVKKGFLGDEFQVRSVTNAAVEIDSPNAENHQRVSKKDFGVMYENWSKYCSERLQRKDLGAMTRFSKYTMSIMKHLENLKT